MFINRRIILMILFFCFYSQSTLSYAEKDTSINFDDLSTELSKCSGVFIAISQILNNPKLPNISKSYADLGRGAMLAGAYLRHINGKIPVWKNAITWSQNNRDLEKTYLLGAYEVFTPTPNKVFPDEIMIRLNACKALNPIQVKVINALRHEMYSQKRNLGK